MAVLLLVAVLLQVGAAVGAAFLAHPAPVVVVVFA